MEVHDIVQETGIKTISKKKKTVWRFLKKLGIKPPYDPVMPLLGKSHGQRSLIGYSPWGRKGSDMTERLYFTSHHDLIHEKCQAG